MRHTNYSLRCQTLLLSTMAVYARDIGRRTLNSYRITMQRFPNVAPSLPRVTLPLRL
jgi:hypothetical protein